jgi:kinesin family member 17
MYESMIMLANICIFFIFSALARALNNVEDNSERELLQFHYTDIQQELNSKSDNLKAQKHKIRGLEREITDIQAEFQLDREDYLETIRKLEKSNKFYEQLVEKAMAHLRRDGRMWDIDVIKSESVWNDDFKKWKLPENLNSRLKLPQARK